VQQVEKGDNALWSVRVKNPRTVGEEGEVYGAELQEPALHAFREFESLCSEEVGTAVAVSHASHGCSASTTPEFSSSSYDSNSRCDPFLDELTVPCSGTAPDIQSEAEHSCSHSSGSRVVEEDEEVTLLNASPPHQTITQVPYPLCNAKLENNIVCCLNCNQAVTKVESACEVPPTTTRQETSPRSPDVRGSRRSPDVRGSRRSPRERLQTRNKQNASAACQAARDAGVGRERGSRAAGRVPGWQGGGTGIRCRHGGAEGAEIEVHRVAKAVPRAEGGQETAQDDRQGSEKALEGLELSTFSVSLAALLLVVQGDRLELAGREALQLAIRN
jgi:hypothetical protein